MRTDLIAALFQGFGLIMLVVGCYVLAPWLGWIIGGVAAVFVGIRIEITDR